LPPSQVTHRGPRVAPWSPATAGRPPAAPNPGGGSGHPKEKREGWRLGFGGGVDLRWWRNWKGWEEEEELDVVGVVFWWERRWW